MKTDVIQEGMYRVCRSVQLMDDKKKISEVFTSWWRKE
jgi:hypothetical protein